MTHQAKKFISDNFSLAASAQSSSGETFTENVNVHGLRVELQMITEATSQACGVNWALLCLPELVSVIPTISDATMADESLQSVIWASGKCIVTLVEVTKCLIEPKTSRSCPPGSRLLLVVRNEDTILGTPVVQATISMRWWETQI